MDIILGFGANLPFIKQSPKETIQAAVAELAKKGVRFKAYSRWYVTAPVPASGQPDFVNLVALAETSLSACDALSLCQAVEINFGRNRDVGAIRWDARTLDIDLLACGDDVCPSPEAWKTEAQLSGRDTPEHPLCLPHPRLHKRAFVLVPFCDVAPDWRHPILGQSAQQLLEAHRQSSPEDVENVRLMVD